MWLVGVVIRRYIDILIIIINFAYSTCIRSFLAAASLLLCSFLNVFSVFIYYIIIFIYIFQAVRHARAVNALRANVGPAG